MAGLPKSIIKKYGVSKKAWAVYRGEKTVSHSTGGKTMAKKKHSSFRRFGQKATSFSNPLQPDAIIYGAVRQKMSDALSPITSKVPLGDVADEVVMGLIDWQVAKHTSGMMRNIALKGLVVENARLGEAIATGSIFGNLGTSSSREPSFR